MAAILPHLEVEEDVTPIERAYNVCVGSLTGLGEDSPSCPSPDAVLADAHSGLLGMVFVRQAVEQGLVGTSFVAQAGNLKGKDDRNVFLVLDQPIGSGPAWNPTTNPGVQQYELLSWTSKMNCPSWSLPAGAPETGGACPGATAGQSVVPEDRLISAQKLVRKIMGKDVNLPQAICEHCVTGDTKVLVEGLGWVAIEDLVGKNFRVWSGIDWRDTHAVFRGIKPTVELTTSWGHRIRATADHKIMTDRGMVAIEDLKEGDRLVFQTPPEAAARLDEGLAMNADRDPQQKFPKVASIVWLDKEEAVYDLVNVGDEHQFVANGITISNCYATGGQYSTGQVQYAQVLRFLWARQAIDLPATAPDGSASTVFIETMVYAIQNANYKLGGGKNLPAEPTGRRFFRIHDSGDFFSKKYLQQWKEITRRLPDITFWAPSRIWATGWGVDAVNDFNTPPENFIIRPSAYEVNEPGPPALGTGWAGASTVISASSNLGMTPEREEYVYSIATRVQPRLGGPDPRYTWNCQAYATNDQKHTCRKAVAPPGLGGPDGKGCRACWLAPNEIINYTLH